MPTPYSCVSTNLNTVDVSVHQSGNLCTWIRASSAIPGVFPPVIVDGMVHVDGGVLNNLPTDLIRKQGAGYVVGVEVGGGDIWRLNSHSQQPAPESDWARLNILELLTRVGSIGDEAQAKTRRKQCDILLAPEMGNIGLLSFKQFDQAIAAGYEATAGQIADLLARGTRREDSEIDAELQL